ncbi:MAG: carboxypeptidase-like regulatory domain-containing protein [Chitinophagaceae bacterium]
MANDHNIKKFTAGDIEKYHGGKLSTKEMHAMEKAALDDPFLADALEGYAVAGVNASADISGLREKLANRIEGARVIPMERTQGPSYRWLRVAAMIIFVVGAGLLVYQFGFNKKSDDIAQADTKKIETVRATDTSVAASPGSTSFPVTEKSATVTNSPEQVPVVTKPVSGYNDITVSTDTVKATTTERSIVASGKVADNKADKVTNNNQPVVSAPSKAPGEQNEAGKKTLANNVQKEGAREIKDESKNKVVAKQQSDKDAARDVAVQNEDLKRQAAASRKADEQYYRNQASNTFRGRVTDASNVGVPFANVTNVQDNAGTYTDANGNFILTSPDSILSVNIRSIGFENNNSQLRNDVSNNRVVLQDDRKSLSEMVVSNQKPNTAARSSNMNLKLEEPVPADGWDNYDTYLVNNLNVPEEYKIKKENTAAVELSFEVDKNGEPVNIRIVKSLCPSCDKEAIRLVKEGPKWKRKAKKGRTTVTIPFNASF